MPIKNILVPTTGLAAGETSMETAFLLARLFGAHAHVLFIRTPVQHRIPAALDGVPSSVMDELAGAFEIEQRKSESLSRQKFEDFLTAYGLDYRENAIPASIPTASWTAVEGAPEDEIVARGAAHDLLVVDRPSNEAASRRMIETALFETGRPVLVTPPTVPKTLGERVMVGWNRSALSARAILAAMPVLEYSPHVTLLTVTTGARHGPSAHDMAKHLAWHEIEAEVKESPPSHEPVGKILLEEAARNGADLVVLGAYSRGRLRELLLGGVTRHVLAEATLPVLMAH